MILQRLVGYYDRISADPAAADTLPKAGYSLQKISFCVVLRPDGTLQQFQSLADEGKKKVVARQLLVPGQGKPTGIGINPCFLWDNAAYMLGFKPDDPKPERTREAFEAFRDRHLADQDHIGGPAFAAVCAFLRAWSPEQAADRVKELAGIVGNFGVFKIAGAHGYVHDDPAVVAFWAGQQAGGTTGGPPASSAMCLVTGKDEPVARLHEPKIKGVAGTQSAGALLVSFNDKAYESFGKEQGDNAPVGTTAAFKYANALNYLLNRRDRRFSLGDATVVFWAERPTALEQVADAVWGGFAPPKHEDPPEDHQRAEQVRLFLSQLRAGHAAGAAIDPDSDVGFYVLGLSPNASRISVRLWEQSSVGGMARRIARHISEVDIVGADPSRPLSIRGMVNATARVIDGKSDYDTVSPRLAGDVMRSHLGGYRYPERLLSAILERIAGDGQISAPRAGTLKAFLLREGTIEMHPHLSKEHPEPAYHCGRLLAVLTFAQEAALKSVNSGVIRRMLGSVMTTPGLQLGRLQKAAEVGHIPKLDTHLRSFIRDELKFINSALGEAVPLSLRPLEQSVFMLGFYQELHYLEFNGAQVSSGKRHRTDQGEWVRSGGEVRMARLLTKLRLNYIYEPTATLTSGPDRWPDFVVRGSSRAQDLYIEYLGMDTPDYNQRWDQKVQAYREFGITETGGSMGRLAVVDARRGKLDDMQMLDALRPFLELNQVTLSTIEAETKEVE